MDIKEVKNGKRLQFINHEFDHFLEAFKVTGRINTSANGFKIRMNGKLVHSSQTFPPFKKKCDSLISEWDLEEN